MIFGNKIVQLREAKGWSQADLAREARVAQPTISSLETGGQQTSRKLPQIAAALGVKVSDLDPSFVSIPDHSPTEMMESAALAFETMVQALRADLTPEERRDLARVFVDLVLEPLAGSTSESRAEEMRLRLTRALIKRKS